MSDKTKNELPLKDHLELLLNSDNVACDETTTPHSHPEHDELPTWFDEKKFRRGQEFYHYNIFAIFAGKLAGLISVLALPTILRILIFTKQSSTVVTSYRRYVGTILHMHKWYSDEFRPGSEIWKSLTEIRRRHDNASRRSLKHGEGQVTQRDMALTQFGFIGYTLAAPEKIGIQYQNKEQDIDGIVHFWRVIGWILGIDDKIITWTDRSALMNATTITRQIAHALIERAKGQHMTKYNLCRESPTETVLLCEQIAAKIMRPAVRSTDSNFSYMYDVLLKSMWYVNPWLYTNSFMTFVFNLTAPSKKFLEQHESVNIKTPVLPITEFEKTVNDIMTYLLQHLFVYNIIRIYFNLQLILAIFLIQYFPFLAFMSFGVKNSYTKLYEYVKFNK